MVYINARFLTHQISGVERFAIEISRALKKIRRDIVWVAPRKGIVLKDLAKEFHVVQTGKLTGHLWEQIDLPRFLNKQDRPLLVNLINTAPLMYDNKLTVVYDVAFRRFPKTFSFVFRSFYGLVIPRVLKTSRKVVTSSNFSKQELESLYGSFNNTIEIIYGAVDPSFFSHIPTHSKSLKEKYFLAVGSIHPQKNLKSLFQAMKYFVGSDIQLYVVGGQRGNFSQDTSLQDSLSSNIKFLGRVSDSELLEYYRNAEAFVFPSLYEGFGIPPLEAQACGVPAVVSGIPVLREVYGDSVLYFNPKDPKDIAKQLDSLTASSELKKSLMEKGKKNVERYSWQKSAKRLSGIIDELL